MAHSKRDGAVHDLCSVANNNGPTATQVVGGIHGASKIPGVDPAIRCPLCSGRPNAIIEDSWIIWLGGHVQSVNTLPSPRGTRGQRIQYQRMKEAFVGRLFLMKEQCKIPDAERFRRVIFTREYCGRKGPYDPDNLTSGLKMVIDAMTVNNLIVDDHQDYFRGYYKQIRGQQNGLLITIQELEGDDR